MLTATKKYNKSINILFIAIISALCGLVFYSYVTTPFTGDIQVFMAAANQVKYQEGNIIKAVFEAWELKGIFNRMLMFVIYSISNIFVKYTNIVAFEICSKLIYGLFSIIVIALSMCILPTNSKKQKLAFGTTIFLAFFATYTAVQMQAEMTVVLLSIFIFSCLVSEKKALVILSGIIGSSFFFYKSVFILLYFAVLIGAFIYKTQLKKITIIRSLLSMAISEILLIIGVKIIYPQEFVDMLSASDFQSTLFLAGSKISVNTIFTRFFDNFTQSSVAIPFLIVSCFCAISLIIKFIKEKKIGKVAAMIFCWLIPLDIIIASNTYFIYHYFLLMIPGIICILTYLSENSISPISLIISIVLSALAVAFCWTQKEGLQQWSLINYSTVLLVIVHLFIIVVVLNFVSNKNNFKKYASILVLTVVCFLWANYSSLFSPKYQNLVELTVQSEKACQYTTIPEDIGDEPVLFLDYGSVPFYIDAPSYSRYFFNLPLQRWSEGKDWPVQQSEYEKLMEYSGKYIVYSSWFNLDKYPELKDKIFSEYTILKRSGIWTYSPDWDVFSLGEVPTLEEAQSCSTYLLIRKDFAQAENYLESKLKETSLNGLTITPNGDGTYTVNGVAKAETTVAFNYYALTKGTYKLVGCIGGSIDSYYLDCRDDNGSQLVDTGDGVVFSTSGQSSNVCRLVVNKGANLSNVIIKPMITNDTTATYNDFIAY